MKIALFLFRFCPTTHGAVGELLKATNYLSISEAESIINDCNELNTMLASIVKTTKENLRAIGK